MIKWMAKTRVAGLVLGLAATSAAPAYDGLVEKKVFTIPVFTTVGGKTIRNVRIGYETYGTLNAAGTNAIFVAHDFSGKRCSRSRPLPIDCCFPNTRRRCSTS
jgi:hypothetical protein